MPPQFSTAVQGNLEFSLFLYSWEERVKTRRFGEEDGIVLLTVTL